VATKKGMTTNFFSPLSFVAVFGSGIRDPGWVIIRIRDKHPGSATLAVRMVSVLAGKTHEERSAELGLETMEERRHQGDMAMVHKIMHGRGANLITLAGLRRQRMARDSVVEP
jgi:hypothetical protein